MLRILPALHHRIYLYPFEDEEKVEDDEGTTRPSG
jgi:hypothetical protein